MPKLPPHPPLSTLLLLSHKLSKMPSTLQVQVLFSCHAATSTPSSEKRAEQVKLAQARTEAALRKQAAAAAAQAAAAAEALDAMYRDLKHEITDVLPSIFSKIDAKNASEKQRAERQARLWRIETFDKGNDQVTDQVDKRSAKSIARRRNQLYQQ
jgi:hypothetical protein